MPHFDSKAIIEKDLAASGLPYTITAPTYFFDNALGGADRIAAGILDLPLPPDRPLQQLARPDLGAFAAKVRPATPSRRRRWPRRSAWLWADLCGTNKHRSNRSAIPICMLCGGSLNGPGYRVDIDALHTANPDIAWTSFVDWAQHTWPGSQKGGGS